MPFIILTFATAIFIEGLGSLVSVIGISALFGSNPIIIALAVALDVGKIVTVSLLYTYLRELPTLMKTYALVAAAVTMIITSTGAAGYLSGEFQKAIMGTKEGSLQVEVLKEQQAKYEERKKQIDDQVAALPTKTTVSQRLRLMNGFKAEQEALNSKIAKIDEQLPAQQIKQIGTEAKAGPILYVAKAFNISVEEAVKWVILMIITVFDPLAIFLIIAGNFLLEHRKKSKIVTVDSVSEQDEPEMVKAPAPIYAAEEMTIEGVIDHQEDVPYEETQLEDQVPVKKREEISRSSLGLVSTDSKAIYKSSLSSIPADHATVVDAKNTSKFRPATYVVKDQTKNL